MIDRVPFEGGTITVEYELAPHMVVFSHDFAVLRDDRGLLHEVAANLPEGFGYVLFDYYDTDATGTQIQIKTFEEHVQRLRSVIDWALKQQGVQKVSLVAHALGCIVTAKLRPPGIHTMLLLAPPTNIGDDLRTYTKQVGGVEHDGIWHIKRPDGVTIYIPESFFHEIQETDGEAELRRLALAHEYTLVLPETDEILPDADYTDLMVMPNVHAQAVTGADHYFEGNPRRDLITIVCSLLQEQAPPEAALR